MSTGAVQRRSIFPGIDDVVRTDAVGAMLSLTKCTDFSPTLPKASVATALKVYSPSSSEANSVSLIWI